MKQLYNIEVEKDNLDIYEVLRQNGMKVESFKESKHSQDYKVLSVVADSEDMLALRLRADVKLVDEPEAAGGFQTSFKLWTSRMKDRLSKIVS